MKSTKNCALRKSTLILGKLALSGMLTLFIGFGSCSLEPDPPIEYMAIRDISKSGVKPGYSAEDIYHHIVMDVLGLEHDKTITYRGAVIYLTWFGASSRPTIQTIKLEPGANWFLENESDRIKKLTQFKVALRAALKEWQKLKADHLKTHIHTGLAHSLAFLKASGFSNDKRILLLTDGWEDSDICVFENYMGDIVSFTNSYSSISEELNAYNALPNLTGLKFIMVHERIAKYDRLCEATDNYWKYQIEKLGGTLSIHPNLMLPTNIPVSEMNIQQPAQN